jgi:hypothetical protein
MTKKPKSKFSFAKNRLKDLWKDLESASSSANDPLVIIPCVLVILCLWYYVNYQQRINADYGGSLKTNEEVKTVGTIPLRYQDSLDGSYSNFFRPGATERKMREDEILALFRYINESRDSIFASWKPGGGTNGLQFDYTLQSLFVSDPKEQNEKFLPMGFFMATVKDGKPYVQYGAVETVVAEFGQDIFANPGAQDVDIVLTMTLVANNPTSVEDILNPKRQTVVFRQNGASHEVTWSGDFDRMVNFALAMLQMPVLISDEIGKLFYKNAHSAFRLASGDFNFVALEADNTKYLSFVGRALPLFVGDKIVYSRNLELNEVNVFSNISKYGTTNVSLPIVISVKDSTNTVIPAFGASGKKFLLESFSFGGPPSLPPTEMGFGAAPMDSVIFTCAPTTADPNTAKTFVFHCPGGNSNWSYFTLEDPTNIQVFPTEVVVELQMLDNVPNKPWEYVAALGQAVDVEDFEPGFDNFTNSRLGYNARLDFMDKLQFIGDTPFYPIDNVRTKNSFAVPETTKAGLPLAPLVAIIPFLLLLVIVGWGNSTGVGLRPLIYFSPFLALLSLIYLGLVVLVVILTQIVGLNLKYWVPGLLITGMAVIFLPLVCISLFLSGRAAISNTAIVCVALVAILLPQAVFFTDSLPGSLSAMPFISSVMIALAFSLFVLSFEVFKMSGNAVLAHTGFIPMDGTIRHDYSYAPSVWVFLGIFVVLFLIAVGVGLFGSNQACASLSSQRSAEEQREKEAVTPLMREYYNQRLEQIDADRVNNSCSYYDVFVNSKWGEIWRSVSPLLMLSMLLLVISLIYISVPYFNSLHAVTLPTMAKFKRESYDTSSMSEQTLGVRSVLLRVFIGLAFVIFLAYIALILGAVDLVVSGRGNGGPLNANNENEEILTYCNSLNQRVFDFYNGIPADWDAGDRTNFIDEMKAAASGWRCENGFSESISWLVIIFLFIVVLGISVPRRHNNVRNLVGPLLVIIFITASWIYISAELVVRQFDWLYVVKNMDKLFYMISNRNNEFFP